MKRYYPRGPDGTEMVEDPCGAYVRVEDLWRLAALGKELEAALIEQGCAPPKRRSTERTNGD